jgi:hypothetical protein
MREELDYLVNSLGLLIGNMIENLSSSLAR